MDEIPKYFEYGEQVRAVLGIDEEAKIQATVKVLCGESDDKKGAIEEVLGSISEDAYERLQHLTAVFLHSESGVGIEDIELFDSLFTVSEKAKLLEMIVQDRVEADLPGVLIGQKMYFIRHIMNNKEAFKLFLIYQLSKRDRNKSRELLKTRANSNFLKYLDRDILSSMKGAKIIDFEKMSSYDSVHTKRGGYPSETRITHEDGIETVMIPGSKKTVEFDGTAPRNVKEVFGRDFEFNYVQSVVQKALLERDDNVLVCAPTGCGKTIIGALSILREFERNKNMRVGYIVPMKALVAEICRTLNGLFSRYGIGIIEQTSDVQMAYPKIEKANIIVSTPEKLDVLTRNTDLVFNLLIIDEIHILNDHRGAVIEAIVARILMDDSYLCRMVGLSASLPNYADVGAFIRCSDENVFYFGPEFRRTAMDYELINVGSREREMVILVEKVMESLELGGPVIVFVHSRGETIVVGKELKNYMERVEMSDIGLIKDAEIKELLRCGVGIHHGGLEKETRKSIEELYRNGKINVLVSTATLAWGVNLPGRTVIVKGVEVYKPELCMWMPLGQMDIMQMFGRAGRFGDDRCKGILICSGESEFLVQKSIDSRLLTSICDCLNAEIVRGISRFEEAVDWIKHTFYYTRLIRMNREPGKMINEIVYSALKHLEGAGLIRIDSGIHSTFMGRISSRYYIHYKDVQKMFNSLSPPMLESGLFSVLEEVREFKDLAITAEHMDTLREALPIPTDSVFGILLQHYVANRSSLLTAAVGQNAPRMFGAVLEIAVRKRLGLSKTILGWCKSVIHRIFPYQTPLRHFVNDKKMMEELEMKEIPFGMLELLGSKGLDEIGIDGDLAMEHLKYVPRIDVTPSVYVSKDGFHIINLDMEKKFDDEKVLFNSYYLFVTDYKDEKLLLCDTLTFGGGSTYTNSYYAICSNSPFLNICVLSSYYLCATEPTLLDMRGVTNTTVSIFSEYWRDRMLELLANLWTENDVILTLFHDNIDTDAIVVAEEMERRELSSFGYKAYTYAEFVSDRIVVSSVTIANTHDLTSNYLIEACIVHCIVNKIRMVLTGLPFTEGDVGMVGRVRHSWLDGMEDESRREVKVYGSCSLSYYSQLADYRAELLSNVSDLDMNENACIVVCPVMKAVLYLMKSFKNGKIATRYSAIKNGIYFVTKDTLDSWIKRKWNPRAAHIHIVGSTYYDYESSSYVDYSLADVKKYSLLSPHTFLYLKQSKTMFYFNNKIPLYYNSSNRKELLIYSHWLGCPSTRDANFLPFIDDGLTQWGALLCKYSVSVNTLELFMQRSKDRMGLRNILLLVCAADELMLDMTSDDIESFELLHLDLSRGRAHALTSYFLDRHTGEMDEAIFESYINTILPVLRRLYMCLAEVSLAKAYLKTTFNTIFGLQNIMKVFVKPESKFYNVDFLNTSVSVDVLFIPVVPARRRVFFFMLTELGGLSILHVDEPGKHIIEWEHDICYVMCDCYPGFEVKERETRQ